MTMKLYFKHTATGKMFEVIGLDKATNMIELRGDYAPFKLEYSKERFLEMGYERVKTDVAPEPEPEEDEPEDEDAEADEDE